ncbi:nucleoside deaminase [Telluribacter sp.]|jgi:tRNA(adenine34) deaminase|uniref:nucleoside deaminase n=1 Tax=Telluribacter sp. TaxID=1978767 RepID=UPI002E163737|nr:nucleoside deaminase [Telluribacter sp.]
MDLYTDDYFMGEALHQAQRAAAAGEIPVGAVVVCKQRIIARGYNQTELLHDVTAHAEIIAITAAAEYLGAKYLQDCTLYVTLEPCVMCAGAIYWAQLGRVVYGASDDKRGFGRLGKQVLHPKTALMSGIRAEESRQLLLNFFRRLRT